MTKWFFAQLLVLIFNLAAGYATLSSCVKPEIAVPVQRTGIPVREIVPVQISVPWYVPRYKKSRKEGKSYNSCHQKADFASPISLFWLFLHKN